MSQINSLHRAVVNQNFSRAGETIAPGKFMGRDVRELHNQRSLLQDLNEEMSFLCDRTKDSALRDRVDRDRDRKRIRDRAKSYLSTVEASEKGENGRKVSSEDELDALIQSGADPEEIVNAAMERFDEPAEAWAMLEKAHERAEQSSNPDAQKLVGEALRRIDLRYGAAIRAGISGTLAAADGYVSLGLPKELGREYRTCVTEFTSTMDLYQKVKERHAASFAQAVDFLEKALSVDLGSGDPSMPIEALHSFGDSVSRLRIFRSVAENCGKFAEVQGGISGDEVFSGLLNLGASPYPSQVEVNGLADTAGKVEIADRIVFIQGLQTLVRNVPNRLFDEADAHGKVMTAIQNAVDTAVEREDQLLSS